MNKWIGIGRLTKDPELRYTPNGVAVCRFTLAVPKSYSKGEGKPNADFIPIIVWQKTGEACANHLHKGSLVAVEGALQIRYYETSDGIKKQATEINAIPGGVRFLDTRKSQQEQEKPAPQNEQIPANTGGDDLSDINLDDLPF